MNELVFEILYVIEQHQNVRITQRELADLAHVSLGSVNAALAELKQLSYIKEEEKCYSVTQTGYRFLDNYKIDTAILMAAGFGSRLLPLTLETPKPLIKVHGKPMIETVIEGLLEQDIKTIYIVLGYREADFYYLKDKYQGIHFVINNEYTYKNNISTIYQVKDILARGHCCISEADLYINDASIFKKYVYHSQYLTRYIEGKTGEWIFHLKNGYVASITIGGADAYTMLGVSHWLPQEAKIIAAAIESAYEEPGHEQLYWDNIVAQQLKTLKIKVSEVVDSQIVEIDTLVELSSIDQSYQSYLS